MSTIRSTLQDRELVVQTLRSLCTFDSVKSYLFFYIALSYALQGVRHVRARGVVGTAVESWRSLSTNVLLLVMRLPSLQKRVNSEMAKARLDIQDKLVKRGPKQIRHLSLPAEGLSAEEILKEMEQMDLVTGDNLHWKTGKLSGAVYHGGDDLEASFHFYAEVMMSAYRRYAVSNPLHPSSFPTIRQMEAEVVSMCLRMFNNPDGAGCTTSGGTESIVMSCKTHRDWARAVKGITAPELVIPSSAHPAFDKGAAYLGIKVHHIPVDPVTRQVNLKKVARAINRNTIMIVGSAVNFPDGNMDDITALSALAKRKGVGLHVDCCLGSFIVPFLEEAGFPIARFDFRLEGVTAISCDTHKYGFAPKGSSVIMYRDSKLREHQYFVYPDWAGGAYGSPTLSGSRPGGLIAGAWATMQYMGHKGYLDSCRSIVTCARTIEAAVRDDFPDLYVLGKPVSSVVAFGSKNAAVNILEVGDIMSNRGWSLNGLSNPPAVHIACTRLTTTMTDQFLQDLKASVEEARGRPAGKGTMVSLYGLGVSGPAGSTLVSRIITIFLDTLYIA
ncbi:hypothetical protein FRB96_005122 [Tulasnella sp. 330]|nr:hypothetical protein FRB96_005122 [Tulasnella sp. 330]KAG8881495.1 hypothetical protein FRB97_009549 [Tulasnella sp. 331]KAG8887569.1 hypothetical protein FRB98_009411 [Tulasnella sp. 332]